MGIFGKKCCAICGEQVKFFGNRKIKDGNICSDCVKKVSPFFNTREATSYDIRNHLAYREQNKMNLQSFCPTKILGEHTNGMKVYIDELVRKFIITLSSDWIAENPDIIDISQVQSGELYVFEFGNDRSNPRFYSFEVRMEVNSPLFKTIHFSPSLGDRPRSQDSDLYYEYERQFDELERIFAGIPIKRMALPRR